MDSNHLAVTGQVRMEVAVVRCEVDFIAEDYEFLFQAVFFLAEKVLSPEMRLQVLVLRKISVSTFSFEFIANMASEMVLAQMNEEGIRVIVPLQ